MPYSRVTVNPNLREPVAVRPAATPLDIYTRPGEPTIAPPPQGNSLIDLAGALAGIRPELNQYLKVQQTEANQDEYKTGLLAAMQNKLSFDEAVKQGVLDPSANPWAAKAYQFNDGKVKGGLYGVWLTDAYTKEGQGITDPAQFSKWLQDKRGEFMQQNPMTHPDQADGFADEAYSREGAVASAHAANNAKQFEQDKADQLDIQINQAIADWHAQPGMVDTDQLAKKIESLVNEQIPFMGRGEPNQIAVRAVANAINSLGTKELADVLAKVNTGNGSLGSTTYAKAAMDKALDTVGQRERTEWGFERQKEEYANQNAAKDYLQRVLPMIVENPTLPPDKMKELELGAIAVSPQLRGVVEEYAKGRNIIVDDPAVWPELTKRVNAGEATPEDVIAAITSKSLSRETAHALLGKAAEMGDRGKRLLQNPLVQDTIGEIRQMVSAKYGRDPMTGMLPAGVTPLQVQQDEQESVRRYKVLMLSWLGDNPKATEWQLMTQSESLKKALLDDGAKAAAQKAQIPAKTAATEPAITGPVPDVTAEQPDDLTLARREMADTLAAAGGSVDWNTAPLVPTAKMFRALTDEFYQNSGRSGTLADTMKNLGISREQAPEFLQTQSALTNASDAAINAKASATDVAAKPFIQAAARNPERRGELVSEVEKDMNETLRGIRGPVDIPLQAVMRQGLNWKTESFVNSQEQFQALADEYTLSGGKSGTLVKWMDWLKLSPDQRDEFVKAQESLAIKLRKRINYLFPSKEPY